MSCGGSEAALAPHLSGPDHLCGAFAAWIAHREADGSGGCHCSQIEDIKLGKSAVILVLTRRLPIGL